jgi:hypothetical protein
MAKNYGIMTIKQLKEELSRRKARVSGRKAASLCHSGYSSQSPDKSRSFAGFSWTMKTKTTQMDYRLSAFRRIDL